MLPFPSALAIKKAGICTLHARKNVDHDKLTLLVPCIHFDVFSDTASLRWRFQRVGCFVFARFTFICFTIGTLASKSQLAQYFRFPALPSTTRPIFALRRVSQE